MLLEKAPPTKEKAFPSLTVLSASTEVLPRIAPMPAQLYAVPQHHSILGHQPVFWKNFSRGKTVQELHRHFFVQKSQHVCLPHSVFCRVSISHCLKKFDIRICLMHSVGFMNCLTLASSCL